MSDERCRKGPFGKWKHADRVLDTFTTFNGVVIAASLFGPTGLSIVMTAVGTIVAAVCVRACVRWFRGRNNPRFAGRPPGHGHALRPIHVAALRRISR